MKVRSPKGENFGKGIREVPLFHEVRRVLEELHIEPDGGEFVIATNDRSSQKNLRTVFEKILRKAGVDPWPRLMQNLRSSRETELASSATCAIASRSPDCCTIAPRYCPTRSVRPRPATSPGIPIAEPTPFSRFGVMKPFRISMTLVDMDVLLN
jgi:hypothetical protein